MLIKFAEFNIEETNNIPITLNIPIFNLKCATNSHYYIKFI